MERRRLGDEGRPGEDGLEEGAVRVVVQGLPRRRVPVEGPIPGLRLHHHRALVGPVRGVEPHRQPAGGLQLGGEEPGDL